RICDFRHFLLLSSLNKNKYKNLSLFYHTAYGKTSTNLYPSSDQTIQPCRQDGKAFPRFYTQMVEISSHGTYNKSNFSGQSPRNLLQMSRRKGEIRMLPCQNSCSSFT